MANKTLFKSMKHLLENTYQQADVVNEAGGLAYEHEAEHKLAQYAVTGCLNGTFYSDAKTQLLTVLELCDQVEPEYIARLAIYSRQEGFMKDMPALLLAVLSMKDCGLFDQVAFSVLDNVRVVRSFVQIIRSGRVEAAILRKCFETICSGMVISFIG